MRRSSVLAAGLLAAAAAPAFGQERGYCPARPGLGTTPCTIDTGRVSVEVGLIDWQRDDAPDGRADDIAVAATNLRIGLTHRLEAIVAWTPYARTRFRGARGQVDVSGGVGDVTLGAKGNLLHPDGSGLSLAVMPFVSLPVGRVPIGSSRVDPGIALPFSYALAPGLSLQATPQVDVATDVDGSGRHAAYTILGGLGWTIAGGVSLTGELIVQRDDDPGGRTTQRLGSVALAWLAQDDLQFDAGAVLGLDRAAPDVRLYAGVARRF